MSVPKVLVVGAGFMGTNHLNNLLKLKAEVSVVDIDEARLKNVTVPAFKDLEEAFQKTKPDIVSICTNTQTHFEVLNKVLDLIEKKGRRVGIFMEKPLVANKSEAEKIIARLKKMEYGSKLPLTCGYLFPYSPAFQKGIKELQNRKAEIKHISTVWVKDRVPSRPTEGVHIDEATHPLDAILNKILRALGLVFSKVQILTAENKRESKEHPICDREKQEKLYKGNENKLIPVVDVTYSLTACGIPIDGHSSFIQAPQKREIRVECKDQSIFVFRFDEQNKDILEIHSNNNIQTFAFDNPNKLLLEWESFLNYFQTGVKSFETPTFEDMSFDVCLTEALELKKETFPLEISHTI